jgi:hypothetical protein
VIDNAVLFSFGKDPRGMPPGVLTNGAFTISGIRIRYIQAIIPLVGLLVAVGLRILFRATRTGKAMLAIVQNREAAQLMGVNARQFIVGAYGISGPLAGIAGVLISPLFTVSSTMGTLFGIKAFAVAILGGIGNAWGVVLAGLIYGVAEALITAAIGSTYTQIITFSLIIAALALRPDGLGNACWDCRTMWCARRRREDRPRASGARRIGPEGDSGLSGGAPVCRPSRHRPLPSTPEPMLGAEGVTVGYGAATIIRSCPCCRRRRSGRHHWRQQRRQGDADAGAERSPASDLG